MSFDDGVVYLDHQATQAAAEELIRALGKGWRVRVAVDDGGLKIAVGYGSWSPPYGTTEEP